MLKGTACWILHARLESGFAQPWRVYVRTDGLFKPQAQKDKRPESFELLSLKVLQNV